MLGIIVTLVFILSQCFELGNRLPQPYMLYDLPSNLLINYWGRVSQERPLHKLLEDKTLVGNIYNSFCKENSIQLIHLFSSDSSVTVGVRRLVSLNAVNCRLLFPGSIRHNNNMNHDLWVAWVVWENFSTWSNNSHKGLKTPLMVWAPFR